MSRPKFVAGNWKMNGSLAANQQLVGRILEAFVPASSGQEVAVCVPFPYLDQVSRLVSGTSLALGAQDVSCHGAGAYTGEVSGSMLLEFGCRYVIVGHSERRALHGETDQLVAGKFAAALAAGLTPILCVGETLAEREAGATLSVVSRQLLAVLDEVGCAGLAAGVVAYEPVWAIGTGRTASPAEAQTVHGALRGLVAERDAGVAALLRILYGGSVKADNAAELFAQADIDGGLIGGASLNAEDFLAICRAMKT